MNLKNVLTILLVTSIIIGNAAIAFAQAGVNDQLDAANTQNTSITMNNTLVQENINALQAQYVQYQSTVARLSNTVLDITTSDAPSHTSYEAIINVIDPMVVKINATGTGLRGFASGIIISPDGYILTVLHNVDNANSVSVTLNTGEQFAATIVDIDAAANLALLKITTNRTDLPVAALGTMSEVMTGQAVIAAGYPMSDELPGPATFTYGIVSALRTATDFYFIQSEVPIAPGSGGGGLFTLDGEVVGLASLAEATGIYLFIPIDLAAPLLAIIPG